MTQIFREFCLKNVDIADYDSAPFPSMILTLPLLYSQLINIKDIFVQKPGKI